MSRAKVAYWLYRTRGADGKVHPRWRFRYHGPDGKLAGGTGYTDKGETRRLAQQLALEADEIRRGVRKAPQAADTEGLKPIAEHIEAYLDWGNTQGGRGGRPWAKDYAAKQKACLAWWTEALRVGTLKDITLPGVEAALQEYAKTGVTGKTLSNTAGMLHAFVAWCTERKFLSTNPLEGLREFDTSVSPKNFRRAFTLEEVGKLLAVTPEPRNLIYRLALVTGYRAGEIKSLCVGDLDFENLTVLLHAENAKDRREAVAALPTDLAEALARHVEGRAAEDELFPEWEHNHAADQITLDMERAGIEKRTFHGKADFHSLRTTHVNLGIELGFDVKTAQALARHKDPHMTMNVYGRANADCLRAAVEKLGEALEGAKTARIIQMDDKREVLALAAGAENITQPHDVYGVGENFEVVGARGIEPPRG
ncbi:MAG: tyrosine-type recombinase/integrase [Planctomycetes bacterium]|nr:tyrosine-type recombinase/integrase [Planctomycetota bacterium]